MRVTKVSLSNFRNYHESSAELHSGRNILIGENAQGKTNFLEAIELIATGKSDRAQSDLDLIRSGAQQMRIEIEFETRGLQEKVAVAIRPGTSEKRRTIEKQVTVNGVTQSMMKALRGRLVAVSFKSQDLYLLRGGPKYRRDWIDTLLETLKPTYRDVSSKYQKVVVQRNRLLKTISESGRLSVSDQDQLKVWDVQLAKFGATIIKHRLELLSELLPKAEKFQEHISGRREILSATYLFSAKEIERAPGFSPDEVPEHDESPIPMEELRSSEESAIANSMLKIMKSKRVEEIARKQSVVGPHRDDICFTLNGSNACDFASQGQQRSLILSLKLAELERVSEMLDEPPILLLDDVLSELDLNRQGLLMSLVNDNMQTLITTTHVDGFKPEWLEGALFLNVQGGAIESSKLVHSQFADAKSPG